MQDRSSARPGTSPWRRGRGVDEAGQDDRLPPGSRRRPQTGGDRLRVPTGHDRRARRSRPLRGLKDARRCASIVITRPAGHDERRARLAWGAARRRRRRRYEHDGEAWRGGGGRWRKSRGAQSSVRILLHADSDGGPADAGAVARLAPIVYSLRVAVILVRHPLGAGHPPVRSAMPAPSRTRSGAWPSASASCWPPRLCANCRRGPR